MCLLLPNNKLRLHFAMIVVLFVYFLQLAILLDGAQVEGFGVMSSAPSKGRGMPPNKSQYISETSNTNGMGSLGEGDDVAALGR